MKEKQDNTCKTCHYAYHHPDGSLICNNPKLSNGPWVTGKNDSCTKFSPSKSLDECIKQATPALSAAREAEGKCHGDMKKTVYISGSITDPQSGKPRDGWQKNFLEAEARLREIGFNFLFFLITYLFICHTMCMWDPSSSTRDWTCTPCIASVEL